MKKFYLLFAFLVFASCEKDELAPPPAKTSSIEPTLERIAFKDLPTGIVKYFDSGVLLKHKVKNSRFGKARVEGEAIMIVDGKGRTSYTIPLERTDGHSFAPSSPDFYFDNLVISVEEGDRPQLYVIRYEPSKEWLATTPRNFKNYSGKIIFYIPTGDVIDSRYMENGVIKPEEKSSFKQLVDCEVKISAVTVCNNGGYGTWECETTYTFSVGSCYGYMGPTGDTSLGGNSGSTGDTGAETGDFVQGGGGSGSSDEYSYGGDTKPLLIDESIVSNSPFFRYPSGSNYRELYPKLTEYLSNKLPNIKDIPLITNAIQDITHLPLGVIQEDLEWGKGPTIKIIQLDDYAENMDYKTVGAFDPSNPEILLLDKDWVNNLENNISDQGLEDAYLFFLGVTVLHEYVHYGDFQNGNNYNYPATAEEGNLFELQVYGEDVGPTSFIFNRK